MISRALCAFFLAVAIAAGAAEVKFRKDGSIESGDIRFRSVLMYGPLWQSVRLASVRINGGECTALLETDGKLNVTGRYRCTITPEKDQAAAIDLSMRFPEKLPVRAAYFGFSVPLGSRIESDGKELALPEQYEKTVVAERSCRRLRVSLPGGQTFIFTGNLSILVQDSRKSDKSKGFEIRLHCSRSQDGLGYALKFTMQPEQPAITPVDLSRAANRGFSDRVADDGKGGWTDQGASNDLSMLKPGAIRLGRLLFNVLDETENGGKAALIVAGKERGFAPQELTLELPSGNNASGISLLHASAWTPGGKLGEMAIRYPDGTGELIPLTGRDDCGNWHGPRNRRNGCVAWRGYNSQTSVGLYASAFPLRKRSPERVTFRITSPSAVWMIAGVTLSDPAVTVPFRQEQELIVREGKEWMKLDFKSEIPEGGPLDFSFLLDAPAGKYGRVTVAPDGGFTFENAPEKRLRLYGENLCERALQLDETAAASLAAYFARMGINSVRLHHHDNALIDPDSPDSLTFDPKALDRFDRLFARLKEQGIYITTDLYTSRRLKAGDDIPELAGHTGNLRLKTVLPVSRAAMRNWKSFARRWMTHRNPYTGLAWGEDPALVFVNLVNEDNIWVWWNSDPRVAELYRREFDRYRAENRLPDSPAGNSNPVFRRFLDELQMKCQQEMMEFLRDELKLKVLLTSQNFYGDVPSTIIRNRFDLVDDHQYHDHPGFPKSEWGLPQTFSQRSAIANMASLPRTLLPNRIYGKPFAVTEFCYTAPNIYRAEGGPLIGGYAALQDWNALYRFAYSFSAVNSSPRRVINDFESANEPMAQFGDRIAAALFVRGDVKTAPEKYVFQLPEEFYSSGLDRNFPGEFQTLGLIARIGSAAGPLPAGTEPWDRVSDRRILKLWKDAREKRVAVSSTGELKLDADRGVFTIRTPRTETVTLKKGAASAGLLSVANADTHQTVAAISLDGRPLAESGSIVLFQLTDVCNSEIRFGNEEKTWLDSKGKTPLLVRRGGAEITLRSPVPYRVTALNCDGAPKGEVPGTLRDGRFSFTARTDLHPGGIMAYHLIRP